MPVRSAVEQRAVIERRAASADGERFAAASHDLRESSLFVCFFFIFFSEVIEGFSPKATTRGKEKTKKASLGDVMGM